MLSMGWFRPQTFTLESAAGAAAVLASSIYTGTPYNARAPHPLPGQAVSHVVSRWLTADLIV